MFPQPRFSIALALLMPLAGMVATANTNQSDKAEPTPWLRPVATSSYVVVVSDATYGKAAWREVVDELRGKHDAAVVVYPAGKPRSALAALRERFPRYACFVARPEEAGRAFVVDIHRLTRELDIDPYTDLQWAILTGYNASDALRIAKRKEPLLVQRAASSMGPGIFKSLPGGGFASSETNPNDFWVQAPGGELEKKHVDPDPVRELAKAFNDAPPDLFVTSGHATERDWQIGYNVRAGQFRCDKGQLYGLSKDGSRHNITSRYDKIYMPMGNCLIGHIPDADCMATAWMHTGGVVQMFGYTAVTFHGFMGWGMGTYFQGPVSLSEAFYFNNQALVYELQTEFPDQASIEFNDFDQRNIRRLVARHQLGDRKLLGHLWDRDSVAFYGDPAWVATKGDDLAWGSQTEIDGEQVVVSVRSLTDGKWGNRPVIVWLPHRMSDIRSVACDAEVTPVVTDNFVLLPLANKDRKKDEVIKVTFGARSVEVVKTGAEQDPVVIEEDTTAPDEDADASAGAGNAPALKRRGIQLALHHAGENAAELLKALTSTSGQQQEDVVFLVANMPPRDLASLSASYLIENVESARRALAEAPWKEAVTESLFRNDVLPYASVTERRDRWRRLFYERFVDTVKDCVSPGEAAVKLNQTVFKALDVSYHATKRPRPDQGPLESIEAKYASCSGLSVLLIDACRAVGIPARFAGVAQWTNSRGNHSWVEVWDDGKWHCLGASESDALDKVWFGKAAASADPADPYKRVYATRFERSTLRFPLAWDPYADYISAVDVTTDYISRFGKE